ncbi:hypothetical protein [Coxiella burnetii]|uniref:hypothetical protein n=1 Tax=Coxiella burnetii TaxID=777 RepID=UPI00016102C1|nr:hypothetical protein COXBURSA331_A1244 [Coxiella burnetii RSA 331]
MSEAKYGKTMMSSIVPVFRFAHTGYLAIGKMGEGFNLSILSRKRRGIVEGDANN